MRCLAFLFAASAALAQNAPPGGLLCAPFGPGGTWNLYQTSLEPLTWAAAQKLAAETKDPKGGTDKMGHLVTIGSAAENMFVYQHVEGWYIWIGLTDNEKHGGREAGGNRAGGWQWVTGEAPGSFTPPWRGSEPNADTTGGEDAVAMEYGGLWGDWPIGEGAETEVKYPFLIEWDTALPAPVEGVRTIGRVLPERWPVDLWFNNAQRDNPGPWAMCALSGLNGHSLREMLDGFLPAMKANTPVFDEQHLNFRMASTGPAAGGWIALGNEPPHPLTDQGSGALHVTKVRVDSPGLWSINIHADDFFAARFPGLKWKRVTGLADVDPLDPETMFYDCEFGDGRGIGIIELPAGEHRLEVFLGNRIRGAMLQVLAAPGEHLTDGATDRWRLPGHKAGDTTLAWPGISDSGWTVTRALLHDRDKPLRNLRGAFAQVQSEEAFTAAGLERIHFTDPSAPGDAAFPDAAPFPGDAPGDQNDFAVFATATLVIPRDGTYHLGIHCEDHGALCIGGEKLLAIVRSTGGNARMDGDTIWEENPARVGSNSQNVVAVTLKKGEYPIEVLYAETNGPSVLSVFGSPAAYPPRLLEKGGAETEPDVDGLPLVPAK
jgi:PA14 domain